MKQPLGDVLREQGRKQTWLGRRIDYSPAHITRVIQGDVPASSEFRRRCAEALDMDEADLFVLDDSAVAEPAGLAS